MEFLVTDLLTERRMLYWIFTLLIYKIAYGEYLEILQHILARVKEIYVLSSPETPASAYKHQTHLIKSFLYVTNRISVLIFVIHSEISLNNILFKFTKQIREKN